MKTLADCKVGDSVLLVTRGGTYHSPVYKTVQATILTKGPKFVTVNYEDKPAYDKNKFRVKGGAVDTQFDPTSWIRTADEQAHLEAIAAFNATVKTIPQIGPVIGRVISTDEINQARALLEQALKILGQS